MLHRALQQFLSDVYWGDLDVLFLDLPPGTGDVALSVAQLLPTAEILVVTTPQQAAAEVAERAGTMVVQTQQRIAGVIENMAWMPCPHCGEQVEVFGSDAENPPSSKAIGEPAARQVRKREAPEEHRLQEPDARLGPAELLHEQRRRDREVPAVHVAEGEAGEREGGEREARTPHDRPPASIPVCAAANSLPSATAAG